LWNFHRKNFIKLTSTDEAGDATLHARTNAQRSVPPSRWCSRLWLEEFSGLISDSQERVEAIAPFAEHLEVSNTWSHTSTRWTLGPYAALRRISQKRSADLRAALDGLPAPAWGTRRLQSPDGSGAGRGLGSWGAGELRAEVALFAIMPWNPRRSHRPLKQRPGDSWRTNLAQLPLWPPPRSGLLSRCLVDSGSSRERKADYRKRWYYSNDPLAGSSWLCIGRQGVRHRPEIIKARTYALYKMILARINATTSL